MEKRQPDHFGPILVDQVNALVFGSLPIIFLAGEGRSTLQVLLNKATSTKIWPSSNRNGSIEVHILIFEIYPTINACPGFGN